MNLVKYDLSRWKKYFFTIWGGQAFSLFGSTLVDFALVWYMTTMTGSAIVLTTATLVTMLPTIFISPILGSLVDRKKRRLLMIFADGLIAIFTVLLALLFWFDAVKIWHIFVLLFVRSMAGITHFMSMQAATSLMVPEAQLSRVAGLNRALMGLMNVAGPPIGALFLTIMPISSVLFIDVATALLAIPPLLFIAIPEPEKKPVEAGQPKVTIFQDILLGFRYIWSWKGLVALVTLAVIANFLITPVFSLVPLLVTEHFGGGALELGWVEAAAGVGTLIGGLALGAWGGFRKRILTTLSGGVLAGIGVLIIAFSPSNAILMAVVGFFLVGGSLALVDGPIFAIFQAQVAPDMQGRVMSLLIGAGKLAAPLGLLIAGPLTEWVGVRIWFFVAGGGWLLLNLVAFSVPALLNLEEEQKSNGQVVVAE